MGFSLKYRLLWLRFGCNKWWAVSGNGFGKPALVYTQVFGCPAEQCKPVAGTKFKHCSTHQSRIKTSRYASVLFRNLLLFVIVLFIGVLGVSGSALALYLTQTPLNVGSYTGILMIIGIIGMWLWIPNKSELDSLTR